MPLTSGSDAYYDPYDFEIDADPYPIFKRMRDEAPLYYNERHDFYALSRFDDVERCSDDAAEGAVGGDEPPRQLERELAGEMADGRLADVELVRGGAGVNPERLAGADVDHGGHRPQAREPDDPVRSGDREMYRQVAPRGRAVDPAFEGEMRGILLVQLAKDQQLAVDAADRARDILLEDAA